MIPSVALFFYWPLINCARPVSSPLGCQIRARFRGATTNDRTFGTKWMSSFRIKKKEIGYWSVVVWCISKASRVESIRLICSNQPVRERADGQLLDCRLIRLLQPNARRTLKKCGEIWNLFIFILSTRRGGRGRARNFMAHFQTRDSERQN